MKLFLLLLVCAATVDAGWIFSRQETAAEKKANELAKDFFERLYNGNDNDVLDLIPVHQFFLYTTCDKRVLNLYEMLQVIQKAPEYQWRIKITNATFPRDRRLTFDVVVFLQGIVPTFKYRFTADAGNGLEREIPYQINGIEDIKCERRRFRSFY